MKTLKDLIREQDAINANFREPPEPESESLPGTVRESGQPSVPDVVVATETPQKKRRGRKPRAVSNG